MGQPAEHGDGNVRFRIGRVLPVLLLAALVAFAPAVIAKGHNDGWHWNDLPGVSREPEVVGVLGPAMRSACRRLPRVSVDVVPDGLAMTIDDPEDGRPIDEVNGLLRRAGLDVEFAVEPLQDHPVGSLVASGGTGDVAVPSGVRLMPGDAGRLRSLLVRRDLVGRAWFTLACQPPPPDRPTDQPKTDTSSVAVR